MSATFVTLALAFTATTYGYGEAFCGPANQPQACNGTAITASGEIFNPALPTAAVPMPTNQRLRPLTIRIKAVEGGPCSYIWVNDKKSARYVGNGGLDLTPGALQALGIKPSAVWSGKVQSC